MKSSVWLVFYYTQWLNVLWKDLIAISAGRQGKGLESIIGNSKVSILPLDGKVPLPSKASFAN